VALLPHTAFRPLFAWRKVATSWVRHTQEVQLGDLVGGQGEADRAICVAARLSRRCAMLAAPEIGRLLGGQPK
jgi:hypothetical protein